LDALVDHAPKAPYIPSFAYPGSKHRLAKHLIPMLPPEGKRFVDVFAGRGNVTWRVMSLLRYEQFWLNDILTLPFLNGLKHSRIYAIPEWRDRPLDDPQPDVFHRMKNRTAGGLWPDVENWREVWSAAYDKARQDGLSEKKAEALAFIAANGGSGKRYPRGFPPAPLLEGYLCYSGGRFTKQARRGRTGGGVTREGFEKKVRAARKLIERHNPSMTRLDYRKVLKECGPNDVVFCDPPYIGADVRAYDDRMLDHPSTPGRSIWGPSANPIFASRYRK